MKNFIEELLEKYNAQETYTDCEEYRRQGAVGALEELLNSISNDDCPFCKELTKFLEDKAYYEARRKREFNEKYKVCIVKENYDNPNFPELCTGRLTGIHYDFNICPICGKPVTLTTDVKFYELVYSSDYLAIGLLIKDIATDGVTVVKSRHTILGEDDYYENAGDIDWVHTGKYYSEEEWRKESTGVMIKDIFASLLDIYL